MFFWIFCLLTAQLIEWQMLLFAFFNEEGHYLGIFSTALSTLIWFNYRLVNQFLIYAKRLLNCTHNYGVYHALFSHISINGDSTCIATMKIQQWNQNKVWIFYLALVWEIAVLWFAIYVLMQKRQWCRKQDKICEKTVWVQSPLGGVTEGYISLLH